MRLDPKLQNLILFLQNLETCGRGAARGLLLPPPTRAELPRPGTSSFFVGRMRLKDRSEKTEIARPKRKHRETSEGRRRGEDRRLSKKNRCPLPPLSLPGEAPGRKRASSPTKKGGEHNHHFFEEHKKRRSLRGNNEVQKNINLVDLVESFLMDI